MRKEVMRTKEKRKEEKNSNERKLKQVLTVKVDLPIDGTMVSRIASALKKEKVNLGKTKFEIHDSLNVSESINFAFTELLICKQHFTEHVINFLKYRRPNLILLLQKAPND